MGALRSLRRRLEPAAATGVVLLALTACSSGSTQVVGSGSCAMPPVEFDGRT